MIGLGPQTLTVARLAGFVTDEQLSAGTPCTGPAVRNLLGHLLHLCVAFRDAARRDPRYDDGHHPERPVPDIGPGRREEPAAVLDELADARRDPDAWTGMTRAGGVDLPGDVAGAVVVEELVVHGWDLAHAVGRPCAPDPAALDTALDTTHGFLLAAAGDPHRGGAIFGPVVPVPAKAALLDRAVGLSGRDPGRGSPVPGAWSPVGH